MDNIILAIEGPSLNVELVKFACYIADLTGSTLTATFIKDSMPREQPVAEEMSLLSYDETNAYNDFRRELEDGDALDQSLEICKEESSNKGIQIGVSRKTYDELIAESRFADIIIADPRSNQKEQSPSKQTRNILGMSECPVLLGPEHHSEITELVHCYDGSPASVFAIKFFTYLFPGLLDLRCILLQVDKEPNWSVDNQEAMQKWLKGHYSQSGFNVVHGAVEKELSNFLKHRPGALITMGSYGRSAASLLFRESHANSLIRTINNPMFISHI